MWVLRQGTASSYGRDWPGAGGSVLNLEIDTLLAPRAGRPLEGLPKPSVRDLLGITCASRAER
jgi:hypothetical protein